MLKEMTTTEVSSFIARIWQSPLHVHEMSTEGYHMLGTIDKYVGKAVFEVYRKDGEDPPKLSLVFALHKHSKNFWVRSADPYSYLGFGLIYQGLRNDASDTDFANKLASKFAFWLGQLSAEADEADND